MSCSLTSAMGAGGRLRCSAVCRYRLRASPRSAGAGSAAASVRAASTAGSMSASMPRPVIWSTKKRRHVTHRPSTRTGGGDAAARPTGRSGRRQAHAVRTSSWPSIGTTTCGGHVRRLDALRLFCCIRRLWIEQDGLAGHRCIETFRIVQAADSPCGDSGLETRRAETRRARRQRARRQLCPTSDVAGQSSILQECCGQRSWRC